ncbi:MerR family transcriptional regulator [Peteryoungia ipomoeae]|uniref:MerR family transcriptional regulator n=1 Tax=Peteryoungia ipomoeae TaxID=1210932 RepID=A0A4V4HN64_9HYPH|nr:MerR family transcriptional regulator [Peteryoungia ipomoeae]THV24896.1 MerR family transcriptional regulator [Peteryoungia ipomoeae]
MTGQKPLKPSTATLDDAWPQTYLPSITLPVDAPNEPVVIADMADYFGVTHRTLHFYEEKGLIAADRIGLMRVYRQRDVERMAVINACREIGMPISVIQDLFEMLQTAKSVDEANRIFEDALAARKRELTAHLSTVHRQLQQISSLLVNEADQEASAPARHQAMAIDDSERNCLRLMAEGYSSARVARALNLTMEETDAIEKSVINKIGAQNRFQAVAKAVLLGLIAN